MGHTNHGLVWILFLPKLLLFLAIDVIAVILVRESVSHEYGEWVIGAGAFAFVGFYLFLVVRLRKALDDPDSEISKKLVLSHVPEPPEDTWSQLVGKRGVAMSSLGPSGNARIDGEVCSVVAESGFINEGQTVLVVKATQMRTVVRAVEDEG